MLCFHPSCRCRFAYGPADATAIHCLLLQQNPDWFYLSDTSWPGYYTCLTALFPGLPGWAGTRKVKPIWILLKQETVSGSGISWTICKSAPRSRQITMPAPHRSVFLQAGCPSCHATNSATALKVQLMPLHHKTQSSLASFKSRLVLPFCYRLTQVVLEKRPLNGCSSSSSHCYLWHHC